ncbi:PHP domain-containing protein [Elusimicrobiota bacterium]
MDEKYIDLHVHTNYSDGSLSPQEVVRLAKKLKISAISITDHDTVEGIPSALEEGEKLNVEIVPGIELSAELNAEETSEMHILGYYIDWKNKKFNDSLKKLKQYREERAQKILKKLGNLGINLDMEDVKKIAGEGVVGRLHFAKAIVEAGAAKSIHEVFQKYLGLGKPACVSKYKLAPEDAIRMIQDVGGIPVLAHPYYGHYNNRELIKDLVTAGLQGIEVWHSRHSSSVVSTFKQLANDLHLIVTGGSDCHGPYGNDSAVMGTQKIPYSVLDEIKKHKERIDSRGK